MKKVMTAMAMTTALSAPVVANTAAATELVDKVVITLTSAEQQTRGMAMVLGNAMQAKGAQVSVLLCDSAGDMALKEQQSAALKPNDVTPEELMKKLMLGGAKVEVCALYLPNKGVAGDALIDGVGMAKPPAMAEALMDSDARVFNF
ncbi:DsrE family protein [Amphritea sp. 1_MG-2023]|uniref:DsrE family protein n=1 Tax=Amphritea sp. 1_MG-2023 TaxID=3062670 RepID=UPI0026E31AE5|nr:DsrE family protein [Amphritea sp. 1_MG-2023]MDO6562111.1 DsrE family protein [Amphritea sp. 1_MG-2023]